MTASRPGRKKSTGKRKPSQVPVAVLGASSWMNRAPLVVLAISAILFLVARVQLLAIPLERDEGSFAYIGHWMFRGQNLYTDMLDSKLPGLYAIYGVFTSLFGLSATGVHMSLLVMNAASALALYMLIMRLIDFPAAAWATSFFLLASVSINFVGFAAHATQLLLPFVLWACYAFWMGIDRERWGWFFLAGCGIALAVMVKQQSALFGIMLATLWWPLRLWWRPHSGGKLPIREWLLLGVGGFLPLVLTGLYYWVDSRWDEMWNWTVTQPLTLAGAYRLPWYKMFVNVLPRIVPGFEPLIALGMVGLITLVVGRHSMERRLFGGLFVLVSFLSVMIGTAYYPHYFVFALPAVALLGALALREVSQRIRPYGIALASLLCMGVLIWGVAGNAGYYFSPDYAAIHHRMYGKNMFPEMEKIGKELGRRTAPGDRIAILGSEPEVLVAAGRESCSKHLMVYSILIHPEISPPLQEEYLREIQACAPEYIVYQGINTSWATGYDKLEFFKTLMAWVNTHYTTIGMAESRGENPGVLVWDEAVKSYSPATKNLAFVLQRKGAID